MHMQIAFVYSEGIFSKENKSVSLALLLSFLSTPVHHTHEGKIERREKRGRKRRGLGRGKKGEEEWEVGWWDPSSSSSSLCPPLPPPSSVLPLSLFLSFVPRKEKSERDHSLSLSLLPSLCLPGSSFLPSLFLSVFFLRRAAKVFVFFASVPHRVPRSGRKRRRPPRPTRRRPPPTTTATMPSK